MFVTILIWLGISKWISWSLLGVGIIWCMGYGYYLSLKDQKEPQKRNRKGGRV